MNDIKLKGTEEIEINGKLYDLVPKDSTVLEEERIKNLPKTWEESLKDEDITYYLDQYGNVEYISYIEKATKDTYKNSLHTEEQAEAILILCQLIWLRDIYNGDWKPDWNNKKECKYCIIMDINQYAIDYHFILFELFAFKSQKVAELFLENFKDLLEQIKGLF